MTDHDFPYYCVPITIIGVVIFIFTLGLLDRKWGDNKPLLKAIFYFKKKELATIMEARASEETTKTNTAVTCESEFPRYPPPAYSINDYSV